mgnify:FL=1
MRYFGHAIAVVRGKFDKKGAKGDTSHFQSLATALSGTVGTGNIAGVAFAIFSFLPVCQFYGAHASVDVFTSALPDRFSRWLIAFWEVVLTSVIILIIWRLYGGLERYLGNGETTLFLQFPVWWAYAASFSAGVVACIVAVYCAFARIGEAVTGTMILPSEHGEH